MSIIQPEISICIPAYKQVAMVERLLNSIICQTFKDYEIIITDDSPDDSVKLLSEKYTSKCRLKYVKNDIKDIRRFFII